ncbi:response regulator transcription factor [Luteibaculum oceani]|uniref:Response regulator transcription factor n=1 Tax=Luteibaculum oceani TaxID=1294296 RepID=A0A5C6UWK1_9FLAO|nr:response regulator transcription factor [Luteibaculum oceani]TXC76960.1 response regulator transcription factor [Luteibaculum oceani]
MQPIKILLADSNQLIRIGLRNVFSDTEKYSVVDEAVDGDDLVAKAASTAAEVVLIDYTSPGFTIDAIPQSREINNKLQFVAITYDQSGFTITNAIKSGVTSYIKKDCDIEEIRDAVKETAAGSKFFCGKILETIQKEAIEVQNIDVAPFSCAPIALTQREQEIILLIAEGNTTTQIAEKLFLSSHTINTHRKNIMTKLGVNNTAAIVMYAVKNNLVSPNKFLFSGEARV